MKSQAYDFKSSFFSTLQILLISINNSTVINLSIKQQAVVCDPAYRRTTLNSSDLATFKRTIQTLGFQNKTHLSRQDVEKLIQELTLSRYYDLADTIRAMDPAALSQLLR